MTPSDQKGYFRTVFAIEDRLRVAIDVDREFENLTATFLALIHKPGCKESARHFRTLFYPLAELELSARAQSERDNLP